MRVTYRDEHQVCVSDGSINVSGEEEIFTSTGENHITEAWLQTHKETLENRHTSALLRLHNTERVTNHTHTPYNGIMN